MLRGHHAVTAEFISQGAESPAKLYFIPAIKNVDI